MPQEIKIPVSANTKGAEDAARRLADSFDDVGASAASIAKGTKEAASGIRKLTEETQRLTRAREQLARVGVNMSEADTGAFLKNWEAMRGARGPATAGIRKFNSFDDWFHGHEGRYSSPREAARHRRDMIAQAAQGTSWAGARGPANEPPAGGGGGVGPVGGEFDRGLNRAGNMAMAFSKSMLALAGIASVMGTAAKAIDLATEEAMGTDSLKRRMGDLGIEFDNLRSQARRAGDGLGVSFVESNRLLQSYVREVGNLGATDVGSLGSKMHTSYGFARSYGLDPAESTTFFGQMARGGVGRDEQGQRRLALLIGDSVAKSGYTGKVDELLRAVADYTSMSARMTLTAPNAGGYLNAMTSLMSTGRPGLDPAGAAALLGQADAATRRGGAMGEASLNFSYAALRNASPGIRPVQGMALMEGGLFGSIDSVFGGKDNPLAKYMGRPGGAGGTTNFQKMMPLLRKHYGNGGYFLNALKNHFGLSSHAQAAALANLADEGQLGASGAALDSLGIDPMNVSATGFQMIGQLANAKGRGALNGVFASITGRKDLSDAQRKTLLAAGAVGGSDEDVRRSMIQAVSKLDISQEKTTATETRDALTRINDALTQAGSPLLAGVNVIRDAVVAMAEAFVPGYMDLSGTHNIGEAAWQSANQGVGKANLERAPMEKEMMAALIKEGRTPLEAAAIVGAGIAESNLDPLASNNVNGGHRGIFQWDKARWKNLTAFAKRNGLDPNDRITQTLFANHELNTYEASANTKLKNARTPFEAAAAMTAFERPGGWKANGTNYAAIEGWPSRLGQTQRLASEAMTPAAAASAGAEGKVKGSVDVNLRHPNGQVDTHRVELKSASGAPAPAGAKRPAGAVGGRAPLVGGTRKW